MSPEVETSKYSVNSTNSKSDFWKIQAFNFPEYKIVSYDGVSLYTSININRVLEHILDVINAPKFQPPKFSPPKWV
jgi:hypothetical protein